jgi:hypothetical protein
MRLYIICVYGCTNMYTKIHTHTHGYLIQSHLYKQIFVCMFVHPYIHKLMNSCLWMCASVCLRHGWSHLWYRHVCALFVRFFSRKCLCVESNTDVGQARVVAHVYLRAHACVGCACMRLGVPCVNLTKRGGSTGRRETASREKR